MRFPEYAKILYEIQGGRKHEFTRELFSTGLDPEGKKIIEELPDDESGRNRLRKYLAGTRSITEIAVQIQPHFEKELFMECMEDWEDHFEKIRTEFEKAGCPVEIDDVPQKLAEIYYEIMVEAATGKNQESSASSTHSQIPLSDSSAIIQPAPKTTSWKVLEQDRNAIAELLIALEQKLRSLSDPLHKYDVVYDYKSESEKKAVQHQFRMEFANAMTLCSDLKAYADRYPFLEYILALTEQMNELFEKSLSVHSDDEVAEYLALYQKIREQLKICSQKIVIL